MFLRYGAQKPGSPRTAQNDGGRRHDQSQGREWTRSQESQFCNHEEERCSGVEVGVGYTALRGVGGFLTLRIQHWEASLVYHGFAIFS